MKVLGSKTVGCGDCECPDLDNIGIVLSDDGNLYLIGTCPECRDICSISVDKIEWSLRNAAGSLPRGN